jgi:hypothetical protein
MANTNLVTKFAAVDAAKRTLNDVALENYYIFAGKHMPYSGNDSITSSITNSIQSLVSDVYDQMLFGKKINSTDVALMISRNTWTPGTVYTMYDDVEIDLFNKQFYVSVQDGSFYNVYKCIDNNRGGRSTSPPYGTAVNTIMTADKYMWKFMFTIDSSNYSKFSTTDYLPIVEDISVKQGAIPGSVETIKIISPGVGYDNYLTNGTFQADDIRVAGNGTVYRLPSSAFNIDNFYTNCLLKIETGPAVNQYRTIVQYNGATRLATLDSAFLPGPVAGDTYSVYPIVQVFNTGYVQSTNCIARAIISGTANAVTSIEVLNVGSNYKSATAEIVVANTVSVRSVAQVRPIISPFGGHGSDPAKELVASKICFRTTFTGTEGSYIPANNDFRTVGIIKNPFLDNVKLNLRSQTGGFLVGETIEQYKQKLLSNQVTVSGNTTVIGQGTSFNRQLHQSDKVIITNGSTTFYTTVTNVVNSTMFTVASNVSFSDSSCSVFYVDTARFGTVAATSFNSLTLTNVTIPTTITTNNYVGTVSSAIAVANGVTQNEKATVNNFFSFVQTHRLIGQVESGTFVQDETVIQTSNTVQTTPTGQLYDVVLGQGSENDVVYLSNVHGIFATNNTQITGTNGAVFNLIDKYTGDLVKDSGSIVYLENIQPLPRNSTSTETIKLVLEF